MAAKGGHTDTVRLMLPQDFSQTMPDERVALHLAIDNGRLEVVDILLKDGRFGVNQTCFANSWTPLEFAIHCADTEIMRRLLEEEELDLNLVTDANGAPLHYAVCLANDGLGYKGKQMVSPGQKRAFIKRRQDVVQILLSDPRVNVNIRDTMYNTPLHLASPSIYPETTKRLLAHPNIDLALLDGEGCTALHRAVRAQFPMHALSTVKALLADPRCNINQTSSSGYTALHWLAVANENDGVLLMLDALLRCDQLDSSVADNFNYTALKYAIMMDHQKTRRMIENFENGLYANEA